MIDSMTLQKKHSPRESMEYDVVIVGGAARADAVLHQTASFFWCHLASAFERE